MSLSMTERLERAIAKKTMTVPQIRAKFPKIKNVYATKHDMRRKGYDVKTLLKPTRYSL